MPRYDVNNQTDDTAYVRLYNPAAYLLRTKNNDPYYEAFTVAARTTYSHRNDANEVVFKVKSMDRPKLRSGNATFSKRNRYDDQQWKNLAIGIIIDIHEDRNTVWVGA
jgi:hypothetical protein